MPGRDLTLATRKVATREQKTEVQVFDIETIEKHFNENLIYITEQFAIADELIEKHKLEQAEEIWRAQIVLLDSAFDFYMHELVKLGILNIFHGEWNVKTEKFHNQLIPMKDVEIAVSDPDDDSWLKSWINRIYATQTLMSYEYFKDSCNLLGINCKSIADSAFYKQGSAEKTEDHLKRSINQLFFRRNCIAHQMDRKRENAERQNIKEDDVKGFINDIKKIVIAIGQEARKLSPKVI